MTNKNPFASEKWKERPGYNIPMPEDAIAPDKVKTTAGKLKFDDGRRLHRLKKNLRKSA